MTHRIAALIAAFGLVFAGLVLADARGQGQDFGDELVICTGVGTTTITLGPDGEPIRKTEPCPDGIAALAAVVLAPQMPVPDAHLAGRVTIPAGADLRVRPEITPAARGPPETV